MRQISPERPARRKALFRGDPDRSLIAAVLEVDLLQIFDAFLGNVVADAAFADKIPPKTDMEETMLDFAPEIAPNSRLSCQIKVTKELDGLIVRMPQSQH